MIQKNTDYNKTVKKYFLNPKNMGEMKNPDGIGKVGNPHCLTPNTKIWINEGLASIKNSSNVDKIISHKGKKEKILKNFKRHYTGGIITLKNCLGNITLTPEHLIYAIKVPKNDKYLRTKNKKNLFPAWYHAEQLEKRDIVLYPIINEEKSLNFLELNIPKLKYDYRSKKIPNKIPVNVDLLKLFGYFISEGNVQDKPSKIYISFCFHINEKELVEDVKRISKRLFGLDIKIKERPEHKTVIVYLYNAQIARWFKSLFGNGAEHKKLPNFIMNLPKEKQKPLIYALWKGDGYINLDRKGPRAGYSTISYHLAQQIKILLLRQRIVPSYYEEKEKIVKAIKHKKSYRIHIGQRDSLIKISRILNLKYSPKSYAVIDSWFDEDYLYTPITKIEKSNYDGEVYNIEVENAHSYISDSFTVHNCGDIMWVYIKVAKKKDKDFIKDIKFRTMGCAAAIATSSMITELAKGKTLPNAKKITRNDVAKSLGGLPPIKMHCSNLAADALHKAIENYEKKSLKSH